MATRTVGAILAETSILLDDEQFIRFPKWQLRTWLNEAQREVSKMTECLRAKTTLDVDAADQFITCTTNLIRISEIYWYADGDSQRYPLVYRDHRASRPIWGTYRGLNEGYPSLYWTEGYPGAFEIGLYPIPSQNGTLELHYYRYATDREIMVGTDDALAIDLPNGWEGTVVSWILMRAFQASREPTRAESYRNEFNAQVDMLITASTRYVDEPGSMVEDDWYDIFGDGDEYL